MLKQNLEQKVSQSFMQSPHMQQSLKILQMSNIDLHDYIQVEIMQSPFLQIQEDVSTAAPTAGNDNGRVHAEDEQGFSSVRLRNTQSHLEDWQENTLQVQFSLREHLLAQINITISNPQQRFIACYLTDNLDENGYLTEDVETIAQALQCSTQLVRSVLDVLYKCDPIGVYARSLHECLEKQLEESGLFTERFSLLLANLNLVASGDFKRLSKLCDASYAELQEMLAVIKTLDPKPGRNFCKEPVRMMIPDIHIRQNSQGDLYVYLEQAALPALTINSRYFNQAIAAAHNDEEKQYCLQTLRNASNLIKAIDQRNKMLLRAVEEIVKIQYEFFLRGINFLKPMTCKDLAQLLNVHESTVSRLGNKIVATPVGTYELKHFFSIGLKANFMENEYSVKAVKAMLKDMVEHEDNNNVLTDAHLTKMLQESGIVISRRTVAKYRETLAIQTSAMRRRQKSIKGKVWG